jgi:hypothetical protein
MFAFIPLTLADYKLLPSKQTATRPTPGAEIMYNPIHIIQEKLAAKTGASEETAKEDSTTVPYEETATEDTTTVPYEETATEDTTKEETVKVDSTTLPYEDRVTPSTYLPDDSARSLYEETISTPIEEVPASTVESAYIEDAYTPIELTGGYIIQITIHKKPITISGKLKIPIDVMLEKEIDYFNEHAPRRHITQKYALHGIYMVA